MSESLSTDAPVNELLRGIPLFAELPDDDLDRLCRLARRVSFPAGAVIMEEGTPGDGLYVIVAGEIEVSTRQGGRDLVLARRGAGEVLGEMSLLEQVPRTATVRATTECEVVVLHPSTFQRLLADRPETAARVLRAMATRLRSTEASLMAREKLASLGTLAAGLAHELNNPAAAIRRATSHLREATGAWRRWSTELARLGLEPGQSERLRTLERDAGRSEEAEESGENRSALPRPGVLEASEAEERLARWLEDRGVDRASSAAATLASRGWTLERIEPLAREFPAEHSRVILSWLASSAEVSELQDEIETSAATISDIVRATRSYTYLDQAPVQDVDLTDTLEATLTILRHEWKHGVEVVRDYGDVPSIEAFGSELTQVWTNLMENAIDAMEGHGTLELRTYEDPADRDLVVVEVVDSGPGIPAETRARIFEPFFTTKPPGEGSGLGLHIAHDIIVNHHGGRIEVDSRPGRTAFVVRLPRRLRRQPS